MSTRAEEQELVRELASRLLPTLSIFAFIVAATLCFLLVMSGTELVQNVVRNFSLGRMIQIVGVVGGIAGAIWAAMRGNWSGAAGRWAGW